MKAKTDYIDCRNINIDFTSEIKKNGSILILGNLINSFGVFTFDKKHKKYTNIGNANNIKGFGNAVWLIKAIQNKNTIYVSSQDIAIEKYIFNIIFYAAQLGAIKKTHKNECYESVVRRYFKSYVKFDRYAYGLDEKAFAKHINNYDMKFDTIIQNPPYSGSLHLDFFEFGINHLKEDGKMVIIEPATWLLNIRKNGKAKKYDELKQKLNGHIESVVIENLNKEFGTGLYVPFATTTINMGKTYETIDCTICGEHKVIESIYDINLVGKYDTIWSILDKVQKYGDMMNNHITNEDKGECMWYTKYQDIVGGQLKREGNTVCFVNNKFGEYVASYNSVGYHYYENGIYNAIPNAIGRGKVKSDKIADCIYGTKTELENWKHFIFNNKLPLFINIVMTIDQHNNSKEFLPWMVDKQYTDDEINKMFGFTDDEIQLIDTTIKKYERNSPWFKRYMCGRGAVSDEAVQNYINEINM